MKTIILSILILLNPHMKEPAQRMMAHKGMKLIEKATGANIVTYKGTMDEKNWRCSSYLYCKCFNDAQKYPTALIAPPLIDSDGRPWWYGGARGNVFNKGMSYSVAMRYRYDGTDGRYISLIAFVHEVSHLLGATHHNSNSIMNKAPLALSVTQKLKHSPYTIRQIRNFIGLKNKKVRHAGS